MKKKIVSNVYKNSSIRFGNEIIHFSGGKAEVTDELWAELKKAHFPGIALEGEDTLEKTKTFDEKDADKTIEVLKAEYNAEIKRLNNIIASKDKQIESLKESVEVWKGEVEKTLKKEPSTEGAGEPTMEKADEVTEAEIEVLKAEMANMSLEELKNLAMENGMGKTKAKAFKEDQKEALINAIIALSKK